MDNIKPIRAGVIATEGKQAFLDTVAAAYDELAADGPEPVALVFALVSLTGGGRTGYHTLGPVEDRNSLYVARAIHMLDNDSAEWDKETMR